MAAVGRSIIWRKLGFRYAEAPPASDDGLFEGTTLTLNSYLILDWRGRLRILISGRLHVQTRLQTNVVVDIAHSGSALSVLAPGDELELNN